MRQLQPLLQPGPGQCRHCARPSQAPGPACPSFNPWASPWAPPPGLASSSFAMLAMVPMLALFAVLATLLAMLAVVALGVWGLLRW